GAVGADRAGKTGAGSGDALLGRALSAAVGSELDRGGTADLVAGASLLRWLPGDCGRARVPGFAAVSATDGSLARGPQWHGVCDPGDNHVGLVLRMGGGLLRIGHRHHALATRRAIIARQRLVRVFDD